MDVRAMRREYRDSDLEEAGVARDPMEQFKTWFRQALEVESRDPSGMTLSTADAEGRPSGRIVLLKGVEPDGFVFYTNYGSRKARELEENPWAALTFWWNELDRQVRIEGRIVRTSPAASSAYFATRPRESQLSAVASLQSRPIPNRQALLEAVEHVRRDCRDDDVSCPSTWGGYRLEPHVYEFWQGRSNRLHDRLVYRLSEDAGWSLVRLAP